MNSHDTDPPLRCPHCDKVAHNLFDFLFACKKCGKQMSSWFVRVVVPTGMISLIFLITLLMSWVSGRPFW